jgi:hypothetical protein
MTLAEPMSRRVKVASARAWEGYLLIVEEETHLWFVV